MCSSRIENGGESALAQWQAYWDEDEDEYIGMLLRDEDEEELRRVIVVVWHSGTASDAGWALETQLGGSHTNRSTYHTLASEGEGSNERCTLFDMITPDDNGHIEFERERDRLPHYCVILQQFLNASRQEKEQHVHRLCV